MAHTTNLVIIGNGMAASSLLSELVETDSECFNITVIGAEPGPAYNRILLSAWLSGNMSADEITLKPRSWYRRHGISLHDNDPVISVDTVIQRITTLQGREFDYDFLVFATGSSATRLAIPGSGMPGVMCLRSLQDARSLQQRIKADAPAVVIGGGLLGLEAACSLADQGMAVNVLHNAAWPMNRQLDAEAGARLRENLLQRGIGFIGEANCCAFESCQTGELTATVLSDGRRIDSSIAVMALGITPEITLAAQSGLHIERAIVVDGWLRSSCNKVFALGECCQLDKELFGLVEPIYKQAKVLATVLRASARGAGSNIERLPRYHHKFAPTRLKVSGVEVFSAGNPAAPAFDRSMAWRDEHRGHYRRLWWQNKRLVAAVMFGDASDGAEIARLIEDGCQIELPQRVLYGLGAAP